MKQTRKASENQLLELAQSRVNKFVEQGVATVEVKSGYALTLSGELKMLKVAKKLKKARVITTFLGAHAIPSEYESGDAYLKDLIHKALQKDAEIRAHQTRQAAVRKRFAQLTPREREVLELLVQGQANKAISLELDISERTVETHRKHVMEKMEAPSVGTFAGLMDPQGAAFFVIEMSGPVD